MMKMLPSTYITLIATLLVPAVYAEPKQVDSPPGQVRHHLAGPLAKFRFVTIPAGSFLMGTTKTDLVVARREYTKDDQAMIDDEAPAHQVTFKQPFLLSQTEVTQKVWYEVMGTRPGPAANWQADNWQQLPVVSVSWNQVDDFMKRLNQLSTGNHYRLPTEAEWEYAARAGSGGLRPFPKSTMEEYAWYIESSNDEIQPVSQLKPNDWQLYDMFGNVWEWVADWYSPTSYANAEMINPKGPEKGSKKIRRGGSFHCPARLIRPAYRAADNPDLAYSVLGFRLLAEQP